MGHPNEGILLAVGDFPEGSATASRLRMMSKALMQGGCPVMIALMHADAKQPVTENDKIEGMVDGIHFVYLNKSTVRPTRLLPVIEDTARGILGAVKLLCNKKKPGFLLLYTPGLMKHALPVLVALIRRIPVLVETCEIRSKATAGSRQSRLGRMLGKFDTWMEWLTPKIARGIIPISHGIEKFYRDKGVDDENSFLLPILVDIDLYAGESHSCIPQLSGKCYFLNSGSFAEKDGIDYLLDAFAQVAPEYPDFYLVFTGVAPDAVKQWVLERMAGKELASRILFTGLVSRQELVWAYQHARALLSCRTNSAYANYGFPTKIGEYLATATPVIATRVGDIESYLSDGASAYLAYPEDVDSIAHGMRQVLQDGDKALQIGRKGQEVAYRHFNYTRYSNPLSDFMKNRITTATG